MIIKWFGGHGIKGLMRSEIPLKCICLWVNLTKIAIHLKFWIIDLPKPPLHKGWLWRFSIPL
jgi:hypothetical protein